MSPLQHIVFVSHSLSSGGAEHVLCRMADYWAACGRDISIITLAGEDSDFYPLDHRVRRVALNLAAESPTPGAAVRNNLARLKRLRAEIRRRKPDVVISFVDCTNVLTLLATWGLRIAIIVSERTDPRHHTIGTIWSIMRSRLYQRANALVVQTAAVKCWADEIALTERIHVIPNSVSASEVDGNEQNVWQAPKPFVVAMGRLVKVKGFDMLIEAFARITKAYPEWSLVIIGEGEERERLTELVAQYGINDRVVMPGQFKTPLAVLRQASLFVLSSRYEGFPNALLEAMSCGLPVISFDCHSGPNEIIRHRIDGVLIPPEDTAALAHAMSRLLADEGERLRLGKQAARVVERFSVGNVMLQWDQLIHAVVAQR